MLKATLGLSFFEKVFFCTLHEKNVINLDVISFVELRQQSGINLSFFLDIEDSAILAHFLNTEDKSFFTVSVDLFLRILFDCYSNTEGI